MYVKIGASVADQEYASAIKKIRNEMRGFSYLSLLDGLLVYLNAPLLLNNTEAIGRLPWVAERLILWLLRDKSVMYKSATAKGSDIQKIIKLAWNDMDKVLNKGSVVKQIGLTVRRLMLSQVPYQNGLDTHALALQLYLVQRLPENSKLRVFLDQRAAMPINEYYELALVYWSHTLSSKPWFNAQFINQLAPVFSVQKQEIFWRSFTKSLNELQLICRETSIGVDEWFQPTYFYKTPCIAHQDAIVPIGRPTLRRYFESLAIDWVEESKREDLRQSYDQLVEQYVSESLKRAGVTFLTEDKLRKILPSAQKTSDFAIDDEEAVVLLEVKNKWLTSALPSTSNPYELKSKLKSTIIKARMQLENTEKALSDLRHYKNKKFFRVIVTTNNLWISNAEILLNQPGTDKFTWVVSLQELDLLLEITASKTKSVSSIFSDYESRQKNPTISTYSFGKYLDELDLKTDKLPEHLVKVVNTVFDKISSKLQR
jgi:hypothetical protein